jgi:hypothetical protein
VEENHPGPQRRTKKKRLRNLEKERGRFDILDVSSLSDLPAPRRGLAVYNNFIIALFSTLNFSIAAIVLVFISPSIGPGS